MRGVFGLGFATSQASKGHCTARETERKLRRGSICHRKPPAPRWLTYCHQNGQLSPCHFSMSSWGAVLSTATLRTVRSVPWWWTGKCWEPVFRARSQQTFSRPWSSVELHPIAGSRWESLATQNSALLFVSFFQKGRSLIAFHSILGSHGWKNPYGRP